MMTTVLAPVGDLLVQVASAVRDTVIMKQVASDRGLFDRIAEVASVLIALALLTLTVVAIPVAFHSRRTYRKVSHLLDRIYGDVTPIVRHAHQITDNVNFITTSIRTDVAKVNEAITSANERVQQAASLTERRMNEFNALLAVVQQEAEQLFLSTASTVRGVREGAAAYRNLQEIGIEAGELDAAIPADDIEIQEEGDGDDTRSESAAQAFPTAPRVRPRQRSARRA
jgi:uncharacterized protein YoxC